MCVSQGAFTWPSNRGAQYLIVLLVHTLLGLGSIACGLSALEGLDRVQTPEWMARVLTAAPFVIPGTQILFAAWFLNPIFRSAMDAAAVRTVGNYALACFALLVVVFGSVGALAVQLDRKDSARRQAEYAAREKTAADAKANAEEQGFRALTPGSPLIEWFRFTEYGYSEEHRQAAREAILKRPALAEDLSAGIASTNTELSMKLMYFVGELPKPPVELAEAVREKARVVVGVAQSIDPAAADSRDVLYEKVHSIAIGVQAAAFGLQRAGVNLTPELQAMADACRAREKASPRDIAEGSERIIKYFADLDKQPAASPQQPKPK
jgi:hypothetical protein